MAQARKTAVRQPKNTAPAAESAADANTPPADMQDPAIVGTESDQAPESQENGNPVQEEPEQPIAQKEKTGPAVYVLEENFGRIINRAHRFWERGSEFNAEKDAELIALFHREGAKLKLKA